MGVAGPLELTATSHFAISACGMLLGHRQLHRLFGTKVCAMRDAPAGFTPILAMPHPLSGAFLKLRRANEHIHELKQEIRHFLDSDPYTDGRKPYSHTIEYRAFPKANVEAWEAQYGAFLEQPRVRDDGRFDVPVVVHDFGVPVQARRPFPARRWGIMVGDIAHNMRSALDHLTWELTLAHQASKGIAPPSPLDGWWRQVQFPINKVARFKDGQDVWIAVTESHLKGIDPNLWTRFKDLQPFVRRPHAAVDDTLWVLQELWNGDKHRAVSVVGDLLTMSRYTVPGRKAGGLPHLETHPLYRSDPGPFQDGAELARFRIVVLGVVGAEDYDAGVNVKLGFRFDVAFDNASPAKGRPLVMALRTIYRDVRGILRSFRSDL